MGELGLAGLVGLELVHWPRNVSAWSGGQGAGRGGPRQPLTSRFGPGPLVPGRVAGVIDQVVQQAERRCPPGSTRVSLLGQDERHQRDVPGVLRQFSRRDPSMSGLARSTDFSRSPPDRKAGYDRAGVEGRRSRCQHQLPRDPALEQVERLHAVERADLGRQVPSDPASTIVTRLGQDLLLPGRVGQLHRAPVDAEDAPVVEQHLVERQLPGSAPPAKPITT